MSKSTAGKGTAVPAAQPEAAPIATVGDAMDGAIAAYLDRQLESLSGKGAPGNENDQAKEGRPAGAPPAAAETQPAETETARTQPEEEGERETENRGTGEAETGTETEGTGETETRGDGETEREEEALELEPELQERINRRIGKEVRKTKEAKEALTAAEARVQELEAELAEKGRNGESEKRGRGEAPSASYGPLSSAETQAEVDRGIAQAWELKRWCDEHAEGATIPDGKGGEREVSVEEVRRARLGAEETILRFGPARRQYLAEQGQFNAQAEQVFPWIKDGKSQGRKIVDEVVRLFPELKTRPGWKLAAGVYAYGLLKLEEEKAKLAGTKPAAAKAPPKQPGKPNGSPVPRPEKVEKVERAAAAVRASGSEAALAGYLTASGVV